MFRKRCYQKAEKPSAGRRGSRGTAVPLGDPSYNLFLRKTKQKYLAVLVDESFKSLSVLMVEKN